MVQPTDSRQLNDLAALGRIGLDRTFKRSVLAEAIMGSVVVVIVKIGREDPSQMSFIHYHYMIKAVSAYRADQSFDKRILPGASRSCGYLLNAHVFYATTKKCTIDGVPIPQQILWCRIPGKSFYHLLARPVSRRVGSHIEVEDSSTAVAENYEYKENPKSGGGDCEEIHGDHAGHVILQKATPRLGRWFGTGWRHKVGNGSLADLDSQLE